VFEFISLFDSVYCWKVCKKWRRILAKSKRFRKWNQLRISWKNHLSIQFQGFPSNPYYATQSRPSCRSFKAGSTTETRERNTSVTIVVFEGFEPPETKAYHVYKNGKEIVPPIQVKSCDLLPYKVFFKGSRNLPPTFNKLENTNNPYWVIKNGVIVKREQQSQSSVSSISEDKSVECN